MAKPLQPLPQTPTDTAPTDAEIGTLSETAQKQYREFALKQNTQGEMPSPEELRKEFNELKDVDVEELPIADKIKAALETLYGGDSPEYQRAWESLRPQIATHSKAYWEDVLADRGRLGSLGIRGPAQLPGSALYTQATSFDPNDDEYLREKKRLYALALGNPETREAVAAGIDDAAFEEEAIRNVDEKQKAERKREFGATFQRAILDPIDLKLAGVLGVYDKAALGILKERYSQMEPDILAVYEAWYAEQEPSSTLPISGPGQFLTLPDVWGAILSAGRPGSVYGGLAPTIDDMTRIIRHQADGVALAGTQKAARIQNLEDSIDRYAKNFGQEGEAISGLDQEARRQAQAVQNAIGIMKKRLVEEYKTLADTVDAETFFNTRFPSALGAELAGNTQLAPGIVQGDALGSVNGLFGLIGAGHTARATAKAVDVEAKVAAEAAAALGQAQQEQLLAGQKAAAAAGQASAGTAQAQSDRIAAIGKALQGAPGVMQRALDFASANPDVSGQDVVDRFKAEYLAERGEGGPPSVTGFTGGKAAMIERQQAGQRSVFGQLEDDFAKLGLNSNKLPPQMNEFVMGRQPFTESTLNEALAASPEFSRLFPTDAARANAIAAIYKAQPNAATNPFVAFGSAGAMSQVQLAQQQEAERQRQVEGLRGRGINLTQEDVLQRQEDFTAGKREQFFSPEESAMIMAQEDAAEAQRKEEEARKKREAQEAQRQAQIAAQGRARPALRLS